MNYEIVELEDMSSAAKRISAKVIVELSREQREEISDLVLELVQTLRHSKTWEPKTIISHGHKPFEVVYIYLYRDMDELNHGLPLARASYIDRSCRVKPMHFSKEFIDDSTTLKLDESYESITNLVKDNKVSGEEFIENLSSQLKIAKEIFEFVESNLNDYDSLSEQFNKYSPLLTELLDDFIGFPDDEYSGLLETHQSLLASLSNIGVITKNKKYNRIQKHQLIKLHFETAQEDLTNIMQELD